MYDESDDPIAAEIERQKQESTRKSLFDYPVSSRPGDARENGRKHAGTDYLTPKGTELDFDRADGGEVTFAGPNKGYGNEITILDDAGNEHVYAHLQDINVKAGDRVSRGGVLGHSGNTGHVRGKNGGFHTHYEYHPGVGRAKSGGDDPIAAEVARIGRIDRGDPIADEVTKSAPQPSFNAENLPSYGPTRVRNPFGNPEGQEAPFYEGVAGQFNAGLPDDVREFGVQPSSLEKEDPDSRRQRLEAEGYNAGVRQWNAGVERADEQTRAENARREQVAARNNRIRARQRANSPAARIGRIMTGKTSMPTHTTVRTDPVTGSTAVEERDRTGRVVGRQLERVNPQTGKRETAVYGPSFNETYGEGRRSVLSDEDRRAYEQSSADAYRQELIRRANAGDQAAVAEWRQRYAKPVPQDQMSAPPGFAEGYLQHQNQVGEKYLESIDPRTLQGLKNLVNPLHPVEAIAFPLTGYFANRTTEEVERATGINRGDVAPGIFNDPVGTAALNAGSGIVHTGTVGAINPGTFDRNPALQGVVPWQEREQAAGEQKGVGEMIGMAVSYGLAGTVAGRLLNIENIGRYSPWFARLAADNPQIARRSLAAISQGVQFGGIEAAITPGDEPDTVDAMLKRGLVAGTIGAALGGAFPSMALGRPGPVLVSMEGAPAGIESYAVFDPATGRIRPATVAEAATGEGMPRVDVPMDFYDDLVKNSMSPERQKAARVIFGRAYWMERATLDELDRRGIRSYSSFNPQTGEQGQVFGRTDPLTGRISPVNASEVAEIKQLIRDRFDIDTAIAEYLRHRGVGFDAVPHPSWLLNEAPPFNPQTAPPAGDLPPGEPGALPPSSAEGIPPSALSRGRELPPAPMDGRALPPSSAEGVDIPPAPPTKPPFRPTPTERGPIEAPPSPLDRNFDVSIEPEREGRIVNRGELPAPGSQPAFPSKPKPRPVAEAEPAPSIFTRAQEDVAKKRELARSLAAEGKPIQMTHPDGRVAIASEDMSKPGMYRVTRFDDDGPIGHTEYPDLESAVRGALDLGFVPNDKRGGEPDAKQTPEEGLLDTPEKQPVVQADDSATRPGPGTSPPAATPGTPAGEGAPDQPKLHKFASTQVNVPEAKARRIIDTGRALIPDDALAGDGREEKPHITVRYGLRSEDDEQRVRDALAKVPPFTVKLGKTDAFPPSEYSDGAAPVMVRVKDSAELVAAREAIEGAADVEPNTFKNYEPHVTLAYVKPERADEFKNRSHLENLEVPVESIGFSKRDGSIVEIPLGRKDAVAVHVDTSNPPSARPVSAPVKTTAKAVERLRTQADKLDADVTAIRGVDRQVNTHRRARMAAGAEANASKLEALAKTIRGVADAIEAGRAPHLEGVSTRAHVEALEALLSQARWSALRAQHGHTSGRVEREPIEADVDRMKYPEPFTHTERMKELVHKAEGKPGAGNVIRWAKAKINHGGSHVRFSNDRDLDNVRKLVKFAGMKPDYVVDLPEYDRLHAMGLEALDDLKAALKELIAVRSGRTAPDPMVAKERELNLAKIPGYFPTPGTLAIRMVGEADIEDGMTVLEPSAGKGNIAEMVRKMHPGTEPAVIEVNSQLRELLEAKGFKVVGTDFLEHTTKYDRILMNPPFENGQDIDHVRHAYELLNPGGRVVAIMSQGPFFRSDKKATAFREWLEEHDGTNEKLPDGSFAKAERSTGVATQLVIIDKPGAAEVAPAPKPEENVANEQPPTTERAPEPQRPVPAARERTGTVVRGKATTIKPVGSTRRYQARYEAREARDLTPSHNPLDRFTPNEDYGARYQNTRHYDANRDLQDETIANASPYDEKTNPKGFEPEIIVNTTPTPTDGPSMIDEEGFALGGNRRLMIMLLVYAKYPKLARAYRDLLIERAALFGLDADALRQMDEPVLVRVIDDAEVEKRADAQTAIKELNVVGTAEHTVSERAVAEAEALPQKAIDYITKQIEALGDEGTLAKALEGDRGVAMLSTLIQHGVIKAQERPALVDEVSGRERLTPAAKQRIEKMLMGRVFRDVEQYNRTSPGLRNKIARAVPAITRLQALPEWDITTSIQNAIDAFDEGLFSTEDQTKRDKQTSLVTRKEYTPDELLLAQKFKDGPLNVARAFRAYAREAGIALDAAAPQTMSMFGEPEPQGLSREEAFRSAFGTAEGSAPLRMASPRRGGIEHAPGSQPLKLTAYHGSPKAGTRRFEERFIGTGEGGAVFGHGFYIAESEHTGKWYRDTLSPGKTLTALSEAENRAIPEHVKSDILWLHHPGDVVGEATKATLREHIAHFERLEREFQEKYDRQETMQWWLEGEKAANARKILSALRHLQKSGNFFWRPTGSVYKVEVPDEAVDRMLDYDERLGKQPKSVQDALQPLYEQFRGESNEAIASSVWPTLLGMEVYRRASVWKGSDRAASEWLASVGIPGLKYWDQDSRALGQGTRNFVVFNPDIIRITHENGEPVSPGERSEALRMADPSAFPSNATPVNDLFFSAAEQAIEKVFAKAQSMKASSVVNAIKKAGDVKDAELEDLGITAYLAARGDEKVTRDEVLTVLDANRLDIREVVSRGDAGPEPLVWSDAKDAREGVRATAEEPGYGRGLWVLEDWPHAQTEDERFIAYHYDRGGAARKTLYAETMEDLKRKVAEYRNEAMGFDETRFGENGMNYVLPGGSEYKEIRLVLPKRPAKTLEWAEHQYGSKPYWLAEATRDDRMGPKVYRIDRLTPNHMYKLSIFGVEKKTYPSLKEAMVAAQEHWNDHPSSSDAANFHQRVHFPEANILASVRINTRIDKHGRRTLFIEEIQSDWHQTGKKRGYQGYGGKWTMRKRTVDGRTFYEVLNPDGVVFSEEASKFAAETVINGMREKAVQNAPMKETGEAVLWMQFAFKRMLRYAAENGYDQIAWTTGDQQVERYSLEEHVERIEWEYSRKQQVYNLRGFRRVDDERPTFMQPNLGELELGEYIGDALAAHVKKERSELEAQPTKLEWAKATDVNGVPLLSAGNGRFTIKLDAVKRLDGSTHYLLTYPGFSRQPIDYDDLKRAKARAQEVANELVAGELEGDQLRVGKGGEGQRTFYDRRMVSFANKYTKKWGGKVGTTEIDTAGAPTDYENDDYGGAVDGTWTVVDAQSGAVLNGGYETETEAREVADEYEQRTRVELADSSTTEAPPAEHATVHALEITPQMRAAALAPQPLYARDSASDYRAQPISNRMWAVTRGDKHLGHWPAATEREAIDKAKDFYGGAAKAKAATVTPAEPVRVRYLAPRNEYEAPVLRVDRGTARTIQNLADGTDVDYIGLSLSNRAGALNHVADRLDRLAESVGEKEQRRLTALADTLRKAVNDAKVGSVTLAVTHHADGTAISTDMLAEVINHEQTHAIQRFLSRLFTKGETEDYFIDPAMLRDVPEFERVLQFLKNHGYGSVRNPGLLAMEVFTHLATGDARRLGLTDAEAVNLLRGFYRAIYDLHGEEGVALFDDYVNATAQKARDEEKATRQTRPSNPADRQESQGDVPGVSRGAADRQAGSARQGVQEPEADAGSAPLAARIPLPSDAKMERIRTAQNEHSRPGLVERARRSLEQTREDIRDLPTRLWDLYAHTDALVKNLQDEIGQLDPTRNPSAQFSRAHGGVEGEIEAHLRDYASIFNDARAAKLDEHLMRVLNLHAYDRVIKAKKEHIANRVREFGWTAINTLPSAAWHDLANARQRRTPLFTVANAQQAQLFQQQAHGATRTGGVPPTLPPSLAEAIFDMPRPVLERVAFAHLAPRAATRFMAERDEARVYVADIRRALGYRTAEDIRRAAIRANGYADAQSMMRGLGYPSTSAMWQGLGYGNLGSQKWWRQEPVTGEMYPVTVVPEGYDEPEIQLRLNHLETTMGADAWQRTQDLADRVYTKNREIFDLAHATGLVSTEVWRTCLNRGPRYVPVERIFEDEPDTGDVSRSPAIFVRKQHVLFGLEGSRRVNVDPFVASIRRAAITIREARRNEAAQTLVDLRHATASHIAALAPGARVNMRALDPFASIRRLATDEQPDDGMGKVPVYYDGRKTEWQVPAPIADEMAMATADMVRVLGATTAGMINNLFKMSVTGANLAFSVSNLVRDVQDYLRLAEHAPREWRPDSLLMFTVQMTGSFFQSLFKTATHQEFLKAGAGFSGFQKNFTPELFLSEQGVMSTATLRHPILAIKDLVRNAVTNPWNLFPPYAAMKLLTLPYKGIANVNAAIEEATKMTAWKRARKGFAGKAMGPADTNLGAAVEARNYGGSPDFSRGGVHAQIFRFFFPFFSPSLAGIRRDLRYLAGTDFYMPGSRGGSGGRGGGRGGGTSGRAFDAMGGGRRGRRIAGAIRTALAIGLSIALKALIWWELTGKGHGDDRTTRPASETGTNIIVYTGRKTETPTGRTVDETVKIPMSHFDQPFFNVFVDALRAHAGEKVDWVDRFGQSLAAFSPINVQKDDGESVPSAAKRSIVASLTPILREPIEQWSNLDSWLNQPIVPEGKLKRDSVDQKTAGRTSPTAIYIAEKFDKAIERVTGEKQDWLVNSPARLEHIVRGFTGGAGDEVMALLDSFEKKDNAVLTPEERVRRIPVIGPVVRRLVGTTFDANRARRVNLFYKNLEQATNAAGSLRERGLDEGADSAREWSERPGNLVRIAYKTELERMADSLAVIRGSFNATAREVEAGTMTREEAKKRFKALNDEEVKLLDRADAIDAVMRSKDASKVAEDQSGRMAQANLEIDLRKYADLETLKRDARYRVKDAAHQKRATDRLESIYNNLHLGPPKGDEDVDTYLDRMLKNRDKFIDLVTSHEITRDGKRIPEDVFDVVLEDE